MGTDRSVIWQDEAPTREQVRLFCEDFLSDAGTVAWDDGTARFYITLPGVPCDPRKRARPAYAKLAEMFDDERWIEVFIHDATDIHPFGELRVITRHADAFTSAVADGLARRFAEAWGGRQE